MYVPNSGQKLARLPYRVNDTWARTDLCRHKRFEICRNESLFAKNLQLCLCLCLERAERYGTRCCCHICNNSIRKQLSSHCFVWLGFFITFRNHRPLFWLGWKQRRLGDMWRSQRCTPGKAIASQWLTKHFWVIGRVAWLIHQMPTGPGHWHMELWSGSPSATSWDNRQGAIKLCKFAQRVARLKNDPSRRPGQYLHVLCEIAVLSFEVGLGWCLPSLQPRGYWSLHILEFKNLGEQLKHIAAFPFYAFPGSFFFQVLLERQQRDLEERTEDATTVQSTRDCGLIIFFAAGDYSTRNPRTDSHCTFSSVSV